MTLRQIHKPQALVRPQAYQSDAPANALERWTPFAAEADRGATISIYDMIGVDPWTGDGVTAKRVSGVLRALGEKPVTVNVNSPGGDMFEGLAIYNLLREHPAEVTVRVMGLAASAASIIAMAGDRVEMGLGSFLMIHNSWGVVVGNQQDMRESAAVFAEFDAAMADIYAARTGRGAAEIGAMMASETWLRPESAIEAGFADGTFDKPAMDVQDDRSRAQMRALAKRRVESALRASGLARAQAMDLIKKIEGVSESALDAPRDAGLDEVAALRLISSFTKKEMRHG